MKKVFIRLCYILGAKTYTFCQSVDVDFKVSVLTQLTLARKITTA